MTVLPGVHTTQNHREQAEKYLEPIQEKSIVWLCHPRNAFVSPWSETCSNLSVSARWKLDAYQAA
jgi:hypothetical protein